jgi:hypothetical protein
MFGQPEQCTEPPMFALPSPFPYLPNLLLTGVSKAILCAPMKDTPATDILVTEES